MKKEMLALIGVIIVLVLYLVFHDSDRTQYQLPALSKLAKKDISKMEIQQSGESIVLTKKDNKWYIEPRGYLADTSETDRMLDVIDDLAVTALASEAKSYQRYDLGDDKKIAVKAWNGDDLSREFDIGKAVSTYQHTFVHLANDPNVYHAKGNFRSTFDTTVEDLRDKTVLSFEKSQIQFLSVTKDNVTKTFQLKNVSMEQDMNLTESGKESGTAEAEMAWQTADGAKADETAIDGLLGLLVRLKCHAYHENENKDDFQDPAYVVEVKGAANVALSVFSKADEDADQYPAISTDNEYPFYLSDTQGDQIIEKIDTLIGSVDKT